MINSRWVPLIGATTLLAFGHASGQVDLTRQVVQLEVTGTWQHNNAQKTKVGTGFFVSDGFVLTAGHVLDAKIAPTDEGVEWKEPPKVRITYIADDNSKQPIEPDDTSILYIDLQVDLALIGTTPIVGRRGLQLRNLRDFQTGQSIDVIAFGTTRPAPVILPAGSIDSPFNFQSSHRGFIDITVPGLGATDSGSPVLLDEQVIGVYTQGSRVAQIGNAAAPISFAAPLLAMAGIDYPQPTVQDLILTTDEADTIKHVTQLLNEIKREIVSYRYEVRGGQLIVNYQKRLASGWDPSLIKLNVRPLVGGNLLPAFALGISPRGSETKSGGGFVPDFEDRLRQYIDQYNQGIAGTGRSAVDFDDILIVEITPTPDWGGATPQISGDATRVQIL